MVGERGVEARFGGGLGGGKLGLKLGLSGGLGSGLAGRKGGGLSLCELGLGGGKLGFGLSLSSGYFGAEFRLMRLHQERFEELEVGRAGHLRMKGRLEARKGRREGGAHGGKP